MEKLTETAEEALVILQGIETDRERAVRCSRDILRETKKMIHSIHTSGDSAASKDTLTKLVSDLAALVKNSPSLQCSGPAEDAFAEYAEAFILDSIVRGRGVPSFSELGIGPGPWVLGLADCLGEMRRTALTSLMSGDLSRAVTTASDMEQIFHAIMMFDIPDAILPIRRKQDIARGVMERTRADVTNAAVMSKIRN